MQGKKTFFVIGTLIFLVIVVILYHNIPLAKRFTPIRIVAVLIVAGAIGNMIDRVVHQYVIDFFYFKLINFPIFNVADIYVTVTMILLLILILFFYKEEDLDFLAESAHADACAPGNPKDASVEDLKNLFRKLM